jgi:thiol-disulfide isomerase/thioredoxin
MLRIHTGFSGLLASIVMLFAAQAYAAVDYPVETSPKPLPELTFKDEQGALHTVQAEKGKLTIVHFWATWCIPCVAELPHIDALQNLYGPQGLKIITLSIDGENRMPMVKNFLKAHSAKFTPYLDIQNAAFKASGGEGVPTTLFLNEKGESIARVDGALNWESPNTIAFIMFNLGGI